MRSVFYVLAVLAVIELYGFAALAFAVTLFLLALPIAGRDNKLATKVATFSFTIILMFSVKMTFIATQVLQS